MTEHVEVGELGRTLAFTFDDMLRFHGAGSPAGVACAFKAMQRAFAALSPDAPPERRSVMVRTAFRGPGARDGFEAVTRAVSDGRYLVDRTLLRGDRGMVLEDFVFEISVQEHSVIALLREGFVTEEFVTLARTVGRTTDSEARLDELKASLATHLMETSAEEVFELEDDRGGR